jgi:hypothetical protein
MTIRGATLTATATTSLQGGIVSSSNTAFLERFAAGVDFGLAPNIQAGTSLMFSLTYFTA